MNGLKKGLVSRYIRTLKKIFIMRYPLFFICFIVGHLGFSQNRTLDSLYGALKDNPLHDTIRVRALLTTCSKEYNSYPEKSKIHAEEALKISKEIDYVQGEGEAIRYVGQYYWGLGDFEQSTKYAYEALRIFESISYTKGLGVVYQLLGAIHSSQPNDFEKAKAFHYQALEMFQKGNDKRNIGYAYNSIGALYLNSSMYDQAVENFQKSLEIRKEIKDKDGLGQSYVNLAYAYMRQKKYNESLRFFEKSVVIANDLDNNTYRLVANYSGMGELHMLMGDYEKAELYLFKSVNLAKSIHNKKKTEDAYERLSRVEKTRGRFENSLKYFELSTTYKDSIYTEDKAKKIAEIETRYETEKKDQLIQLLERDKKIQSLWRNIFVTALVLVTLLSLVVYFLQRYRERKNRAILNLQIDSLTNQQSELSEKYKNVLTSSSEKSLASHDQRLLKKAIEIVEHHMSDPLFGVEKMAEEIGMSRTNMHRKLKAITGFPPSELIRSIRLRKAALLLRNETDSISQISFNVGFEDHSYFSKAFKKQFGVSPSEYSQSKVQMD
jgi:AraC-like DNA-binding protein/tetratricopeptide (TPR) repeat protein